MQNAVACLLCVLVARAAAQQNGDVRLVGGDAPDNGRLEVYKSNNWTSVCFNWEGLEAHQGVAQTVCRQLGFNDFSEVGNVTKMKFPMGEHTDKLTNPDCALYDNPQNAPQHIFRCFFIGGTCPHTDDMGIRCSPDSRSTNPYDTMVDFFGGSLAGGSVSEGYPTIYLNGKWGSVCNMDSEDADSFCRQLSYTGASGVVDGNDTLVPPEAVLDDFHCTDKSHNCLRECFKYPKPNQEVVCSSGFSYVTCIFKEDAADELIESFGSFKDCTSSGGHGGAVAAGIIVSLLMVAIAAAIVTAMVCYFVPGCYFHGGKRVSAFSPGGSGSTKYDSI